MECPCELLKNADVRLESLGEDKDVRKWEDAFWRTDRWCLALSATKLLNDAEKEFCTRISEYYNEEDYSFYLGDLEQILTEEDKRHIEGSMDAFAGQFPDGIRVGYQADEKIIENTGELDRFSDIEYVEMQSSLALFRDGVQKNQLQEQAIINITIASMFMGGAAIVVALLVEAIHIQANSGKRRDQILDNIADNIFPEIRRKVEEKIPDIERTINEQFSGQGDRLCATALSMLDDKKIEMQEILRQRNQSENVCRQETIRREAIYKNLFQCVAQVYHLVYDKPLPEERLDKLAADT